MYIEQNEIVEKGLERIGREKGGGVGTEQCCSLVPFIPQLLRKKIISLKNKTNVIGIPNYLISSK